jgi:RimJ/RimL family protein N-acetyltransferase
VSEGVDRIETDRLLMRRFTDDDREPFAVINADPEVTRYLSGPMSRAESDAYVERIRDHWDRWGYGLYAVELLADPGLVGFVGLSHHRAMPDEVEIGWRLARRVWGSGVATEGALAARDVAFGALGLLRLVSITTDENLASRRVMEKLGFRYDRHTPYERWTLRIAVLDRPEVPPRS